MNLLEILREVRRHLEESGRMSVRMLRRQFELDDESLAEVIEELIDVQRVATRDGNVLVWTGAAAPRTVVADFPSVPVPAGTQPQPPRRLADKILRSKPALEDERKQVTVLFADVKGSMDLAEQLDPEQWSAIMQRFFTILSQGVERFDGFVPRDCGRHRLFDLVQRRC